MRRYLILLFLPLLVYANDGNGYDIAERTLNFALFFGFLVWLLKSKIIQAHEDRINKIAKQLDDAQISLKESARKKELAKKKLLKSKQDAESFMATFKKETQNIIEKINIDLETELLNLEKSYQEKIEIQRRHAKREVISEVLADMFEGSALNIEKEEFVNIILKKVA